MSMEYGAEIARALQEVPGGTFAVHRFGGGDASPAERRFRLPGGGGGWQEEQRAR